MTPEEFDFAEALNRRIKAPRTPPDHVLVNLHNFHIEQGHFEAGTSADEKAAISCRFWAEMMPQIEAHFETKSTLDNGLDNASLP